MGVKATTICLKRSCFRRCENWLRTIQDFSGITGLSLNGESSYISVHYITPKDVLKAPKMSVKVHSVLCQPTMIPTYQPDQIVLIINLVSRLTSKAPLLFANGALWCP